MTRKERTFIYQKLEWLYGQIAECKRAIDRGGNEYLLDILESDRAANILVVYHIWEILGVENTARPDSQDAARILAEMEEAHAR
jgi:hypothetical protein